MLGHPIKKGKKKAGKKLNREKLGFFDKIIRFFATGFFSGYFPAIPGTAGSCVGLIIWSLWGYVDARPFTTFLFVLCIYVIGVVLTSKARKILCEADHNLIVWDEMMGMFIAASFIDPGYYSNENRLIFTVFLTYRLLNILKPFPLRKLQELPGGWGIMTDDIVSGVIAMMIFYLPLQSFWVKQLGLTISHGLRG